MFPITLEAIIFLKYNSDWWGLAEVKEALSKGDDDVEQLNEEMQDVLNYVDNRDHGDDVNEEEFDEDDVNNN